LTLRFLRCNKSWLLPQDGNYFFLFNTSCYSFQHSRETRYIESKDLIIDLEITSCLWKSENPKEARISLSLMRTRICSTKFWYREGDFSTVVVHMSLLSRLSRELVQMESILLKKFLRICDRRTRPATSGTSCFVDAVVRVNRIARRRSNDCKRDGDGGARRGGRGGRGRRTRRKRRRRRRRKKW